MTKTAPFRICPITGHYLISEPIRDYLFSGKLQPLPDVQTKRKIINDMRSFGLPDKAPELLGQVPCLPSIWPEFKGNTVREHLENLASEQVRGWKEPLLDLTRSSLPPMPNMDEIVWMAGWHRYAFGKVPELVPHPLESAVVFDCETLVRLGNTAVMAAAVSSQAWYVWLHPAIADQVPGSKLSHFDRRLVPMGTGKIVVGHNVGFDKARCLESYQVETVRPSLRWWDTMAMHYAVSGLSNQQRQLHVKVSSDLNKGYVPDFIPRWYESASMANLLDVYNHHVRPAVPLEPGAKDIRDIFVVASDVSLIYERRADLVAYNLKDVAITAELLSVLLPKYLRVNPSDICLNGALIMGDYTLTLANDWLEWCQEVENCYKRIERDIEAALAELANDCHAKWLAGELDPQANQWLKNLDWTPAKTGKAKGHAAWFRKTKAKGKRITTRSTVAPYLLGLAWEGSPLVNIKGFGWCYKLTDEQLAQEHGSLVIPTEHGPVRRVPHKGGEVNCGSPLAKDYLVYLDNGLLSSEQPECKDLLAKAASISYWISVRKRVLEEVLVQRVRLESGGQTTVTIPGQVVHGTVTRRAVEKLWLTVCSSKANRVGSELKAKVTAPDGWVWLQADFDSQEQRFGAMLGDTSMGLHGSTPMGRITISGTKENRDDAHWILALALGIARDPAKTINYAMLYGAMVAGLAKYLKQANSSWPMSRCVETAKKAIEKKRGHLHAIDEFGMVLDRKPRRGQPGVWVGGTDSATYNVLERISNSPLPRSPILGSCISEALRPNVVGTEFATSRANWVIQTSGVDLLHSWLTGFNWLRNLYDLPAKVVFSYHDEVLVMCKRGFEAQVSRLMQIAHLWAWACASEALGVVDLPATYAWFSGINVDHIWRKEPDMSQVTPSHSQSMPQGMALKPWDIWADDCQTKVDEWIANW